MLFDDFNIVLNYRGVACELDIKELYGQGTGRKFEVIQGGICILLMIFECGEWQMCVMDNVPLIVKQDTETFVSKELVELLIQGITNYFDCFTNRKIKR